jgi:2-dehydropantoate 2-reductase
MKIAVMGAGGIGGYVGGRLAQAGEAVHFIARGRNLEALRRGGLRIECPLGDATLAVAATDDPASTGPVDLVLVAVKLGATDAAARRLAPLIGDKTRIVTLQNGIDAREMIARHVEEHRISAGSMYLSAVLREPGVGSLARRRTSDHRRRAVRGSGHRRVRRGMPAGDRSRCLGDRRYRPGHLVQVRHARGDLRNGLPGAEPGRDHRGAP